MLPDFEDINPENLELLEQYRELFASNPEQLDEAWRIFFESTGAPSKLSTADNACLKEHYRMFGHLEADFYPSGLKQITPSADLPVYDDLRKIYCGKIGYEFYPQCSKEICEFIISKIEISTRPAFSKEKKQQILHLLNKAESFETFLHTKYVGQKRFSLEGAETLIPMLATFLEKDLSDLIIGMPHRGRLNVLVNILNKSYGDIFSEFEDVAVDTFETSGDVKYHKGYSAKVRQMLVVLAANPSHLESVDAVVEGIARAKEVSNEIHKVLPVLVHGDAAVSGQGVVYETLQMSNLPGYKTGGTIHIVINNHIGFTTLPEDGRSTTYCTDIAKAFGIPVFHVNAEDPESCMFAVELAFEIRQRFGSDVFIDMNCWRKYGHNESDEPAFTQPLTYQKIRKKASIRAQYHDQLVQEGIEVAVLDDEFKKELQQAHVDTVHQAEKLKFDMPAKIIGDQCELFAACDTKVAKAVLEKVVQKITQIPEGFTLHPRLLSQVEARKKTDFTKIDWAFAESLAFGTLLQENVPIRLAGQDSKRGTFSQRHGMWVDQVTDKRYIPHASMGDFELVDSYLSEYAALGFEYGYSLARAKALVIWEAQFGDFANGAQIVIDQYMAPGEQKWGAHSKLVLLLPHGYEGQGPEHSSARIERFLILCAENNMFVVYPTTPAQYFHLIRRQVKMPQQKPLIVFTPKGLLRAPECTSDLLDFTAKGFQEVIDDTKDPQSIHRLIFCSGRIYFDLLPKCESDTAIIRLEQLYPLHQELLTQIISRYKNAHEYIWAQEEPYNMGARGYIQESLLALLPTDAKLEYRGRVASSSPACGSHLVHQKEHTMIIESLFKGKS